MGRDNIDRLALGTSAPMNPSPSAKHRLLFSTVTIGVIATILAAASEAVYTPTVKLVSADTGVLMSLAFVFLGAGCGSLIILGFGRKSKAVFDPERHVRKKDVVKLICLIGLTLLSFGLNLVGIQQESAATASLLQNVVIVSTVLFAALFLKEKISKRLGIGVTLIVLGSAALAVTNITTLSFSTGAIFLIAGCLTMGVLFIVSKLLAERNPIEVIIIRGFGTGILVFILAFCMGESLPSPSHALGLMAIGFIACGLSPLLMMYGQRYLGAAKAGAVYGIYPLLGALFAIPILGEMPSPSLLAALILFIPGMYFVITKHTGNTAAAAEQRDERMREDAEYLQPISKEKKAGMRNQLTSFGFLVVAMFFVLMVLDLSGSAADTAGTAAAAVFSSGFFIPGIVLGILLFLIGIILLVLGKRVLTAVTFILMVPQMLAFVLIGNIPVLTAVTGIFSIIFAFILLTSKDPQKYAFAAVNALLGVAFISNLLNSTVCCIIVGAASVFLIWLSLVCGTGKLQHSVSKHLTEDGDMTFSRCGAVIGFLLIAQFTVIELAGGYLMDSALYTMDSYFALGAMYAFLIAFVGAMLLFIGKRQMTAVFFFGSAAVLLFEPFCDGVLLYLPAIFGLVFGVLIILRGASLLLPTALVFGDAFAVLLYIQIDTIPEVETAMFLIALGCAAVAVYLAFAVFSEKPKLPVF